MIPLHPDDFYFPTKTEVNPAKLLKSNTITNTSLSWGEAIGFIPSNPKAHRHFQAIACGPFATLGWPKASKECLQIISDMLCVAFAVDDICDGDVAEDILQAPAASEPFLSGLCEVLYNKNPNLLNGNPLLMALLDLKKRLLHQGVSELWMQRFAQSFGAWINAVREENDYKSRQVIPDPDTLMNLRPDSGAAFLFMHFIEHANHLSLSPEIFDHPDIQQLRSIAGRLAIYPNEIWSYQKELAHGHSINLITTFIHHKQIDLDNAIQCVIDMHNIEMMSVADIVSKLLKAPNTPQAIRAYAIGIQHFLHGLFVWGLKAKRYSKDFFDAQSSRKLEGSTTSHHRIRRISPAAVQLLKKLNS